MTLSDVLGANAMNAKVIASDIDTEVLEKARKGVYRIEELKSLNALQRQRHFMKGSGNMKAMRVKPALGRMIDFRYLNLTDNDWQFQGQFDAIFCRNVMIYFDKDMQKQLLERFVPLLKPDGLLFIGHSENLSQLSSRYVIRGQTVYSIQAAGSDEKIKVLCVDDSALMRQLMREIINSHPDMTVVDVAPDPYVARDLIKQHEPDVVTLDVEMPRMDGIDFLEKLMRLHRTGGDGLHTDLQRLGSDTESPELGAVDFVTKPQIGIRETMMSYRDLIGEKSVPQRCQNHAG